MNNLFIILASGKSKRFKSKTPKQFIIYKNKPIYAHSIDKALKSKLFSKIILVTNSPNRINIKDKNLLIIKGGMEIVRIDASREESTRVGLAPFLWRAVVRRVPS